MNVGVNQDIKKYSYEKLDSIPYSIQFLKRIVVVFNLTKMNNDT